ncbi:hypothetical protein GRJ2_003114800 [Grus japonensis]|uniref:Reverse transcriptase n=1 Tax=Grus japonensis TaxID=30415 RepID=A0ABC9YA83_GRUJA
MHRQQYRTNRDSLVPIHKLIHRLESQGVISRTRSPFNSPIWPVWKSNGEWRLTVVYIDDIIIWGSTAKVFEKGKNSSKPSERRFCHKTK